MTSDVHRLIRSGIALYVALAVETMVSDLVTDVWTVQTPPTSAEKESRR